MSEARYNERGRWGGGSYRTPAQNTLADIVFQRTLDPLVQGNTSMASGRGGYIPSTYVDDVTTSVLASANNDRFSDPNGADIMVFSLLNDRYDLPGPLGLIRLQARQDSRQRGETIYGRGYRHGDQVKREFALEGTSNSDLLYHEIFRNFSRNRRLGLDLFQS